MKSLSRVVLCLLVLVFLAGCASVKVSDTENLVTGKIPRPNHILVYNFAATPADAPELANQYAAADTSQTDEQIQVGRHLGAQIASEVAAAFRAMGLPADAVPIGTPLEMNDIVFKGYLISVQEGSAAKRVTIGFGSGASELRTAVVAFQMTPQGMRRLGSGSGVAGGNTTPGGAMGVAGLVAAGNPAGLIVTSGMKGYGEVSGSSTLEGRAKDTAEEIADRLKPRFQEQGWIQ
jgi:Domain of unknown function (DUF4410)